MSGLSREEKSELGRRGAATRWAAVAGTDLSTVPKVIAEGVLAVGDIPCAVVEGELRLLSRRGVGRAIGRQSSSQLREAGGEVPFFLAGRSLKPFIPEDLRLVISKPVVYLGSGGLSHGVPADVLPRICKVWVDAKAAGVLKQPQMRIADNAQALLSALAGTAMVALVDEATGYQDIRPRDALAKILARFLAKELQPWQRTFEPDFYKNIFRLHGWRYDPTSVHRPRRVAALTVDIVYQRLAPNIREELKKLVKKYQTDRNLKYQPHLHRGLTREHGWIKLREHLASVDTLLDIAPSWDWFMRKLDLRHPRYGSTLLLPYRDELDEENS
jgi:P63C domain-containing protein